MLCIHMCFVYHIAKIKGFINKAINKSIISRSMNQSMNKESINQSHVPLFSSAFQLLLGGTTILSSGEIKMVSLIYKIWVLITFSNFKL